MAEKNNAFLYGMLLFFQSQPYVSSAPHPKRTTGDCLLERLMFLLVKEFIPCDECGVHIFVLCCVLAYRYICVYFNFVSVLAFVDFDPCAGQS